ncbi:hypothetical protein EP331_10240 [bacterium]|nr:MAG: hypothetical protein EP331_10240 [bacterium]
MIILIIIQLFLVRELRALFLNEILVPIFDYVQKQSFVDSTFIIRGNVGLYLFDEFGVRYSQKIGFGFTAFIAIVSQLLMTRNWFSIMPIIKANLILLMINIVFILLGLSVSGKIFVFSELLYKYIELALNGYFVIKVIAFKRLKIPVIGLIIILCDVSLSYSQHSIVPANHQVYDWLHYQRVRGFIMQFDYESLPLTRGQVTKLLNEVKDNHGNDLSGTDTKLLRSYLQEFDAKKIGENELYKIVLDSISYKEKAKKIWHNRPNPTLFTYKDSVDDINITFMLMRANSELNVWENDLWRWGRATTRGMMAFGSFHNFLGVHFEMDNIFTLGDPKVLNYIPKYGYSYARTERTYSNSYSYENAITLSSGIVGFDIGNGSLQLGPGLTDPLWLSREGANFNWVRFTVRLKWLTYTALHGSLYAKPTSGTIVVGSDTVRTRYSVDRWIAQHRLTLRPLNWLELSLHESIVYSNNDLDLAYFNPVSSLFFSERESGDRDNALLGADIIVRPFKGTELYAGLLIDDLVSFGSIFNDKPEIDDDVASNFGLYQTLPFEFRLGVSYSRIEPFVYTHWQLLNTYEQRGLSLGHRLGPNADELAFQIKKFLPYRAWVTAQISFVRKGLNIEGAQNNSVENAGGDLLLGNARIGKRMFQDSDLHAWTEYSLESQIEPLRGLILHASVSHRVMTKGSRLPNLTLAFLSYRYGF